MIDADGGSNVELEWSCIDLLSGLECGFNYVTNQLMLEADAYAMEPFKTFRYILRVRRAE